MSLSVSAPAPVNAVDPAAEQTPRPTLSQKVDSLAVGGQSVAQIATTLGVSVSDVQSLLGDSSSSTAEASALLAANQHFSVHA